MPSETPRLVDIQELLSRKPKLVTMQAPLSPPGYVAIDADERDAICGELAALRERVAELEGQLASAKTLLDASVRTGVIAQARNAALDEAADRLTTDATRIGFGNFGFGRTMDCARMVRNLKGS